MAGLAINLSFLIPQPTGLSTYALNLLPHLAPLDPLLLTAQPFPAFRTWPVPPAMTSDHGAKGHLRRLIWTQFRLPRLLAQTQTDLLFCPIPEAPIALTPWANPPKPARTQGKTRRLVMVHDLIPLHVGPPRSRLRLYFQHYVRRVVAEADHVICNSQATADDVMRSFGLSSGRITPIPLAHDADRYRWLNLPTAHYFLYLGRNDPYKNLAVAIAAFASFLRSAPARSPEGLPWEFWLAGPADPRYQPALDRQVADLGLGDRVRQLGYVPYDELPIVLNQAIALVFPSRYEGFGLPALEAMACGTPVIAANRASLPEVIGDAGYLLDPDRPESFAAAMRSLALEPSLRKDFQRRSLDRAAQFSWQRTGQATAAHLAALL